MAMRAPDADANHEEHRAPGPDDPVLLAIRSAPVVDGEPSEEELAAIREWEEAGCPHVDGALVTAQGHRPTPHSH
jgi:hypothetical protein